VSGMEKYFCSHGMPLRDLLGVIDHCEGISLVVDEDRRLLATITDGDVRRGMLSGLTLDDDVGSLLKYKARAPGPDRPISANVGSSTEERLALLAEYRLRHLPIIDERGRVIGLDRLDDVATSGIEPANAVVMVGGQGDRMRPLTYDTPKPMLPIGDKPIMSYIIDNLKRSGVRRISLATRYKGDQVREFFGDGADQGLDIQYVEESEPRGTAGALSSFADVGGPVLVVNGDILTDVDFRAMFTYHEEHSAALTIGLRKCEIPVPYGVVEMDGWAVSGIVEKPCIPAVINAGIYIVEPELISTVPKIGRFDMTELAETAIQNGHVVAGFFIHEYWIDIGSHEDYQQAEHDIRSGKVGG